MANGNKEIRFSAGLDQASFRQVDGAFSSLIPKVKELARALQQMSGVGGNQVFFPGSMGGGGGGFGRPSAPAAGLGAAAGLGGGIIQNLRSQQMALTAISSGSKDAMKAMVNVTKMALADQRRELSNAGKDIDDLAKRYNNMAREAARLRAAAVGGDPEASARADLASRYEARTLGQLTQRLGEAGQQRATIADLERTERRLGGPNAADVAMIAAGVAQGLSRIAGAGAGLATTVMRGADISTATTMMTGNRILGQMAQGDYSGLLQLYTPNAQRILGRYGTGVPAGLQTGQRVLSAAGQTLQGAVTGAAVGGAVGGVPGAVVGGVVGAVPGAINGADALYGAVDAGTIDAAKAAQIEAALQLENQFSPGRTMAMQSLMAHAGTRIHGAKALQGRAFRAMGIGAGYGLDFGQSVSQAESILRATGNLEATFGVGAKFGQRAKPGTGGYSGYDVMQMQAFGQAIAAGAGASIFSPEKATEMFSTTFPKKPVEMERVQTQKAQSGYMDYANRLMRMGFSQSAAIGSLTGLGEAAIMSGGIQKGETAPSVAYRQLMEVFARGTEKGFQSEKTLALFSEAIAKGMNESAFGVGGAVGGFGQRLEAYTSGLGFNALGREATMRDVQNAAQAQGALNQLTQQNPYINMLQTASAMKALGPGGSGLAARALQMSSMSDLLGGNEFLTAAGVTSQQRMETLQNTAGGILSTYARGGGQMSLEQKAAAITANTGYSMDVSRQMVAMLEFNKAGVFTKARELNPEEIKKMQYGDFAESLVGNQAKAILRFLGKGGEEDIRELYRQVQKEGGFEKGLEKFMQNVPMATGEFQPGNQYVVQVMSGPLQKGRPISEVNTK
jgi:hypothetical protein